MRAALAVLSATLLLALAPAAASARTVVKTRHNSLGTYLVDAKGNTLYRFMKDTTRKSRCNGSCAQFWPPLIKHGKLVAGGHAKASKLSTSKRRDGSRQVVYAGHPLYRFSLDNGPGDTNGEGIDEFGGRWWLVSPAGRRVMKMSAPAPSPYGY